MTKGFFPRLKQKVIGAAATALSAPSVLRSQGKEAQSNFEADSMRLANKTKNVDLTGMDYRNPIFRAQMTKRAVMAGRTK